MEGLDILLGVLMMFAAIAGFFGIVFAIAEGLAKLWNWAIGK